MDIIKILLVEDDGFLRQVYSDRLQEKGYTVVAAADGEDALAKLQQGGWDLVLMDVYLPKINGIDIVKQIQEKKSSLTKKLLFLTNVSDDKELDEIIRLSDGYLIKSEFTPSQLVQKVAEYLPI